MITFQQGVNAAVLAAVRGTLAASELPGGKRNAPGFKVVEEQAVLLETADGNALKGLGPLVDVEFSNAAVQSATDAVTREGRAELQEALSYGRLALHFERALNSRSILARRRAIASAIAAFSGMYSTSYTSGTVNGAYYSATTTTHTSAVHHPLR